MRLENKVAVITGGASGMGRATAELFALQGCKVVIAGRRETLGTQIANNIKNNGADCIFVSTDVSVSQDVQNLMQQTVDTFGKIDILFNNAGINNHAQTDPHEEEEDFFDSVISINLKGAFLCIKYAAANMIQSNSGSIINNSSVLDFRAADNSSTSYHMSIGGMSMLTKKASLSYAKYNIRVNSIQPGAIATEMSGVNWDELSNEDISDSRKKIQPLQRMGLPMDVAYAALYFASDESSFVTGSSLLVDGGMSAAHNWKS